MYKQLLSSAVFIFGFLLSVPAISAGCDVSEEGYLTMSDGANLRYKVAGEGHPLLFLHGGDSDQFGFLGMDSWDPQFCEFAESYRVIRYDMRHIGDSDAVGPHPIFDWSWDDTAHRAMIDAVALSGSPTPPGANKSTVTSLKPPPVSASNQKLYRVPHRSALALGFSA